DSAAEAIGNALQGQGPDMVLHMAVDAQFQAQFQLRPASGGEIVSESNGIRVHFDVASAQRARGLEIDWKEDARGAGLAIRNPNAPPPVAPLQVEELQQRLQQGGVTVVDVRPAADRARAPFPAAHEVLDEDSHDRLAALPKDT